MDLTPPRVLVTAEDVEVGKPDPACYLLGRERIGLGPGQHFGQTQNQIQNQNESQAQIQALPPSSSSLSPSILVLEDAPSGIRAGKAAGCTVIGVGTTHDIDDLIGAGVDYVVSDLTSIRLVGVDRLEKGRVEIEVEISELSYAGTDA